MFRHKSGSIMSLNPEAPAWTPGLCSGGDRSGDSLDRTRGAAHRVGAYTRGREGVQSGRAGKWHPPVIEDKNRANTCSRKNHSARKKESRKSRKKRRRGRARHRLAMRAAQVARAGQRSQLVKAATYNEVPTLGWARQRRGRTYTGDQ